MNSVLVTNHKGGVGKTFVSVHLAKCLADAGQRVLLVDCDGQFDAFRFFSRVTPDVPNAFHEVSQKLQVLANEQCLSLKRLNIEEEQYDYVLIDGDARLADAVKNILQNQIRLVLAPVNFQALSIENLEHLFLTVGRLYGIDTPFEDTLATEAAESGDKTLRQIRNVARNVAAHVIVVPLAADSQALKEKLKQFQVKTKVQTMKNMPWLQKETDHSLSQGKLLWEVPLLTPDQQDRTRQFFVDLAGKVVQYFRS
jgi:chromosome partitioning protein